MPSSTKNIFFIFISNIHVLSSTHIYPTNLTQSPVLCTFLYLCMSLYVCIYRYHVNYVIMLYSVCRSVVRICSNWSPEETITDQKDKLDGEVSDHRNYYNVIPGKTPPPGGIVDLRITRRENEHDEDTQRVRVNINTTSQTIFRQLLICHLGNYSLTKN